MSLAFSSGLLISDARLWDPSIARLTPLSQLISAQSKSTAATDYYSPAQLAAFKAIGAITLVLYSLLLVVAIYNTYFFLCKQRRYRIYFITVFYSTAYVVILARISIALAVLIVAC